MCFARDGSKPHRIRDRTRCGSFGMLANDRDRLRGSNVVARLPIIIEGSDVEMLGEDLLTA